jgi:hypothetical protein
MLHVQWPRSKWKRFRISHQSNLSYKIMKYKQIIAITLIKKICMEPWNVYRFLKKMVKIHEVSMSLFSKTFFRLWSSILAYIQLQSNQSAIEIFFVPKVQRFSSFLETTRFIRQTVPNLYISQQKTLSVNKDH